MMHRGSIPLRPTGSDEEALFMQRQWDQTYGAAAQIQDTPTVRRSVTTKGVRYAAAAAGNGGGTSLMQCVITQLFGTPINQVDYIGATQFDLASLTLTGSQFNCAKCIATRQPGVERIDGQIITYSGYNAALLAEDSADNVRTANFSVTNNEIQVVHRRYLQYPADGNLPDGADIAQYLINVSTLQNGVGMLDVNNNLIIYEEMTWREWAYSPALNGGND